MGRDSNSRHGFPCTRFPGVRLRHVRHRYAESPMRASATIASPKLSNREPHLLITHIARVEASMKRFGYVSTAAALAIATAVSLPFTRASAQSTPSGSAKVELPGTLAGRTVAEWLDAWNSGDSVKLGEYYRKWHLQRSLAAQMERRRMTGAFDVVSIERSEPRLLEFVVKERNTPNTAFTIIEIAPGDTTLTQSFLSRIPPGKSAADFRIDAATRKRVIEE